MLHAIILIPQLENPGFKSLAFLPKCTYLVKNKDGYIHMYV